MNLTQKLSALLMAGSVTLAQGQGGMSSTVVWGVGSGDPTSEAQGQFDGGLTGWTNVLNAPAGADWVWDADGQTNNPITMGWINNGTAQFITSPSIGNGCALFDSDGLEVNQGVIAPQNGSLESPSMDLSAYAGQSLAIRFYAAYFEFQIDALTVSFSPDNGTTWIAKDFREMSGGSGVRAVYNGWITVALPGALAGGGPLTNCKIRFGWGGDYYFASIDDVSVLVGSDYDYDLGFVKSLTKYDNLTTAMPAPFKYIPLNQAKTYAPYIYAAIVKNHGSVAIPTGANPRIGVAIEKNNGGTWTSVYSQTVNLPSVPAGSIQGAGNGDTLWVGPVDITTAWQSAVNTNGIGHYRVVYTASVDANDFDSSNDQVTHEWWVTENNASSTSNADGLFSAVPFVNNNPKADAAIDIAAFAGPGNVIQNFEWGNIYYFGDTADVAIDSVIYTMLAATGHDMTNASQMVVSVNLYEWVDANSDNQIALSEFTLRTLKPDTINLTSGMLGTYITRRVTLEDPNEFNPVTNAYDYPYFVNVNDITGLYYVGIAQTNVNGFLAAAGQRNYLRPAYVNGLPYNWTDEVAVEAITPLTITEGPAGTLGSGTQYSGFSGAKIMPSQGIKLTSSAAALMVSTKEAPAVTAQLELFPNPVANVATLTVELDKMAETVRYILTDAQGRVLNMETRNNIQSDVYSFDASKLPAGAYILHVRADGKNFSKTFVKN